MPSIYIKKIGSNPARLAREQLMQRSSNNKNTLQKTLFEKQKLNMKKLLSLLIASILCVASYNSNATEAKKTDSELIKKPIRIHIDFLIAAPRFHCESGIGICKAGASAGGSGRYTGVNVGGYASYENGVLVLEFLKSEMDAAMLKKLQSLTEFTIESDYTLPAEISEALKSPRAITISARKYPIRNVLGNLQITIGIKF